MDKLNEFMAYLKEMDLTTIIVGTVISYSLADFSKVLVNEFMGPFRKKMASEEHKVTFYGETFDLGKVYTAAANVFINLICAFILYMLIKRID